MPSTSIYVSAVFLNDINNMPNFTPYEVLHATLDFQIVNVLLTLQLYKITNIKWCVNCVLQVAKHDGTAGIRVHTSFLTPIYSQLY